MNIIYAVAIAFVLDILFGDPIKIPHIVVAIGKLISLLEKGIRKLLPKTNGGSRLRSVLRLRFCGALALRACSSASPACGGKLFLLAVPCDEKP